MSLRPLVVLSLLIASAAVFAAPPSPVVTAASAGNNIRFSSPGSVCQIHVEIDGSDGTPLYDSSWKDGNVLDWTSDVASGTYRCVIEVRDLDGTVTRREAALVARDGQVTIDGAAAADAKVTLLAHDGTNGAIVSTGGDLSFRFGDFLAGKDVEKMRLTSGGMLGIGTDKPQATLDVNGSLRVTDGILFSDGSLLTTQSGQLVLQPKASKSAATPAPLATRVIVPLGRPATPRTNVLTPRFVTTDTGVGIWNAAPAFTLDVGGIVNTSTSYSINSTRIVYGDASNTFLGAFTGTANVGANANTFVGADAGPNTSGGTDNTFVGVVAGDQNVSGSYNTFVGSGAGVASVANSNTFVGHSAGSSDSTGTENAYFGNMAGGGNTTGSDNVAIGASAYVGSNLSYATAIGAHAACTQGNAVEIGSIAGTNGATATQNVGITLLTPNQALAVGGGITVDAGQLNNGTDSINTVVAFGVGSQNGLSGEAIGSQRTTGGNQFGLDFYTQSAKRVSITNSGQVGIGTSTPSTNLEVAIGLTTLADNWTTRSSARFKKNIEPISGALDKTEALRGVTFDYKDSGAHSLGFIAEEVANVIPEAVTRDAKGEIVGLDYNRVTPLLVEAVKTQQRTIQDLEERLAKLEAEVAARK